MITITKKTHPATIADAIRYATRKRRLLRVEIGATIQMISPAELIGLLRAS